MHLIRTMVILMIRSTLCLFPFTMQVRLVYMDTYRTRYIEIRYHSAPPLAHEGVDESTPGGPGEKPHAAFPQNSKPLLSLHSFVPAIRHQPLNDTTPA